MSEYADRDPRNWPSYISYVRREATRPYCKFEEPFGSREEEVAKVIADTFKVPLRDVSDDLIDQYCQHRQNQFEEDALEANMYDEYGEMKK